jgi:hypothetical protein
VDITQHPLGTSFDVITAFRVFLNAEPDLGVAAIQAIYRHLAADGRLVCNIHMNASSPMGAVYRRWNKYTGAACHKTLGVDEFLSFLRGHGFVAEQVRPYGYCPRPGPFLPKLCEAAVPPVERICKTVRLPGALAQSVMVVASKSRP